MAYGSVALAAVGCSVAAGAGAAVALSGTRAPSTAWAVTLGASWGAITGVRGLWRIHTGRFTGHTLDRLGLGGAVVVMVALGSLVGQWALAVVAGAGVGAVAKYAHGRWFEDRATYPIHPAVAGRVDALMAKRALTVAEDALSCWRPEASRLDAIAQQERTGIPDTAVRDVVIAAVLDTLSGPGRDTVWPRRDRFLDGLFIRHRLADTLADALAHWRRSDGYHTAVALYAGGAGADLVVRVGILEALAYAQSEHEVHAHGAEVIAASVAAWCPSDDDVAIVNDLRATNDDHAALVGIIAALATARVPQHQGAPTAAQHQARAWVQDHHGGVTATLLDRWDPTAGTVAVVAAMASSWGASGQQRHVLTGVTDAAYQLADRYGLGEYVTAYRQPQDIALVDDETLRQCVRYVVATYAPRVADAALSQWRPSRVSVDRVLGLCDAGLARAGARAALADALGHTSIDWDTDNIVSVRLTAWPPPAASDAGGDTSSLEVFEVLGDMADATAAAYTHLPAVLDELVEAWDPPSEVISHLAQLWEAGRPHVVAHTALRWVLHGPTCD